QTLEQLAGSQVKSGLSPSIDSFRATVERQSNEQRLAVAEATLAKDKLALGRAIGLPAGQRFALSTTVAFKAWDGPGLEAALQQAARSRTDLQSAEAALRAAELAKSAAEAQHLPSLAVSADYGQVGKTYAHTDGTFSVNTGVTVPIWNGGKSRAAVAQADAVLARRRAEYEDLKGRIDTEVRSALLDLAAAETSVKVAQQNIELAGKTLTQAQDRFANGVTNNVEVVLAQGAVTAANESYIVSLFSHNLAKLQLLRAMGLAEHGVKQYLSGQTEGAKE
ncbi:MAG TPA: TolC family protein, partial [Thermoanaerobaculia bacterium]